MRNYPLRLPAPLMDDAREMVSSAAIKRDVPGFFHARELVNIERRAAFEKV